MNEPFSNDVLENDSGRPLQYVPQCVPQRNSNHEKRFYIMSDVPAASVPPPPTFQAAEDMCQYARERYREIARWRSVWTVLLFLVGCAIVVFVILSIISFSDQKMIEAAAGAIGTLISGAAMAWVVTRRNEAVTEENEAWQRVEQHCGKTDAAAQAIRAKTQFLRFTKGL